MGKKLNLIHVFVLAILLFLPLTSPAAPLGKITQIEGSVDITRTGQAAVTAVVGDPVNQGDILRAKSKSKAEVTFNDGNILRLAEGTRVRITQYDNRENQKSYLDLFRGKTQSVIKTLQKGSAFEIHTPTAVAGVRGTTIISFFIKGVSGALFKDGGGYGYNRKMPGDVKAIAPGQAMIVTGPDQPPIVKPATSDEIQKHLLDTTPAQDKEKKDAADKGQEQDQRDDGAPPIMMDIAFQREEDPFKDPQQLTTLAALQQQQLATQVAQQQREEQQQQQQETVAYTTSTGPLPTGGIFTGGTISSSINDATNTGTLTLAATLSHLTNPGVAALENVALSDGSVYNAFLSGIPGSWNGLFRGIYLSGSGIGLLSADLTGNITGNSLTASGILTRDAILGQPVSGISPIAGLYLPTFKNIDLTGATTTGDILDNAVSGYPTATGGLVGIWGLTTTGGTFYNPEGLTSWTARYGFSSEDFAILGDLSGADDGNKHVSLGGEMLYLDSRYFGLLNLAYRGVYATNGAYQSAGAGTYRLAPLAYRGTWGLSDISDVGSLYYNYNGLMSLAGHETGLIGGLARAPWIGTTDFKAIGQYSYESGAGNYTYYLWNSAIQGYDPAYIADSSGGYFKGATAGIWGSSRPGSIRAIYVTPGVNNLSTAGILTSDDIAVSIYSDVGMWMAGGTLGPSSGLTYSGNAAHWTVSESYSQHIPSMKLAGSFTGATGSYVTGNGSFATQFLIDISVAEEAITGPPWGIYNLKLSESNTFSGKPAGEAAWSVDLGGQAQFGYGGYLGPHHGYWLARVADATGRWTDDGQITGTVSGNYLTPTHLGTLGGPFYGVNNGVGSSGTWIGESIGVYQGAPLKFSSQIEARKFSGSERVLATFNIPTIGSGLWWDVAVVETSSGVSTLYSINRIDSRTSDTYPMYSYTKTSIGTIVTPVYFRLTWGASPRDLDSHAWIPATGASSSRYHVYFGDKGTHSGYPYAFLDQDITTGYGPEMLSFSRFLDGDTFYSIYNYSGSPDITTSDAQVQILYGMPDITPIFNAYFGGTDSLWGTGPVSVAMMGQLSPSAPGVSTLWHSPLYSYNSLAETDTTYDGGAYRGFIGGLHEATGNTLSAFVRALYRDPNGNVGLIYTDSPMSGHVYPDVGMLAAEGNVYTYQMFNSSLVVSDVTAENFYSRIQSWDNTASGPALPAVHVAGTDTPAINLQGYVSSTLSLNDMLSNGSLSIGQAAVGGSYSGAPRSWSWIVNTPWGGYNGYVPEETWFMNVAITATGDTFTGRTAGAEIDWADAQTKVTGGQIQGLFDPAASTWKALTQETRMRTEHFIAKVQGMTDAERLAFQKATNIPAFQVGQANLAGSNTFSGGSMTVALNGVTFFAPSTGGAAGIWASAPTTGGVTGTYTGAPTAGLWEVTLTQQGAQNVNIQNASFQLKNWNTAAAKWGATVVGTGTVNSQNIGFTGGAAGAITSIPVNGNPGGAFSGTAAGIVTPQPADN